jgi:hypothetical protein
MDAFQWIVLGIATVVLVLILVGIGYMMANQSYNIVFPPTQSTCPDSWVTDPSGTMCFYIGSNGGTAKKNLGTICTVTSKGAQTSSGNPITMPTDTNPVGTTVNKDFFNKMPQIYYARYDNTSGNVQLQSGIIVLPAAAQQQFANNFPGSKITCIPFFNLSDFKNSNKPPICAQQTFANQHQIYWDGVNNTNQCSTSS